MSHKKRTQTPQYQWEQTLAGSAPTTIIAGGGCSIHCIRSSSSGKQANLDHMDMDEAIHQTYKPRRDVYGFFTLKREFLVRAIQLNEEWFQAWVKDNPPPAGYKLG